MSRSIRRSGRGAERAVWLAGAPVLTSSRGNKMAAPKRMVPGFAILLLLLGCTVMAVDLYSANTNPEVQEFQRVELSCVIKHTNTDNPRVEWKKIRNGDISYVFFDNIIQGDLKNRAEIKGGISLVIFNASRTDTGRYRCEVAAAEDQKRFSEITINLTVTVKPVVPQCKVPKSVPVGKSAVMHCQEKEGYPSSVYRWYRNGDPLPDDSKSNPKFLNSSFMQNISSGTLVLGSVNKGDIGQYYCIASNAAGSARCEAQLLEVFTRTLQKQMV
ncbi:junctional adhesion molecule C isoform X2 [Engystomops pustulosus]